MDKIKTSRPKMLDMQEKLPSALSASRNVSVPKWEALRVTK